VCSIVLLRKSSGSLDLLTEARVVRRFPRLRTDLPALYAAYYIAELLSDLTEDYDPHPNLFEEALATLEDLGTSLPSADSRLGPGSAATGLRLARFELVFLRELGYSPTLDVCALCETPLVPPSQPAPDAEGKLRVEQPVAFSAAAGGVLCPACAKQARDSRGAGRDRRPLSAEAWNALRVLGESGEAWQRAWSPAVRTEVRQVLGQYVTYLMGRQPRLLPYLGS
jgi:DNA repair protein RecO (recombination protein O)